jgi:signal transduction histidine kinase
VSVSRQVSAPRQDGPPSAGDVLRALRSLRNGQVDESNLSTTDVQTAVATSLSALMVGLRWGAALVGLAWAATEVNDGNVRSAITLSIVVFLASWRTVRPLRLGDSSALQASFALADVAILAGATGVSEGLNSPFVGCVLVAVAIVSFGWGLRLGLIGAGVGLFTASMVSIFSLGGGAVPGALAVASLAGAAVFPGVAQSRLLELESRGRKLEGSLDKLAETNQLLGALNNVTRLLPSSLDLAEVLHNTRQQLIESFGANRLAILTFEDSTWAPQVQDGFNLPPILRNQALPDPLHEATTSSEVLRINDLSDVCDRTGSGMYSRLVVAGADTGLVALENKKTGHFTANDAKLLAGTSEVLALTIANARAFGQLRSLAAAEERTRIARDLHDRLGQYLTYISMEIERINTQQIEPSSDLKHLHEDTQSAIAELRDTLMDMRAAVSSNRPLSVLLKEAVDRVRRRTAIADITLSLPEDPSARLTAIVENELLRIAQEALTNIEKHANATQVHVGWSITGGKGILTVQDDGRGFDPSKGIRGNAYGLVGMRERAASVGAILEVTSEPDQGTVISVLTSQNPGEINDQNLVG